MRCKPRSGDTKTRELGLSRLNKEGLFPLAGGGVGVDGGGVQGLGVRALQAHMNPSNEKLMHEPDTKLQISHCTV